MPERIEIVLGTGRRLLALVSIDPKHLRRIVTLWTRRDRVCLPVRAFGWRRAAMDMRRGFDGLSAQVHTVLKANPLCGHVFVFRNRSGERVKVLWYDGQGMCLFYKRLEKGCASCGRAPGAARCR